MNDSPASRTRGKGKSLLPMGSPFKSASKLRTPGRQNPSRRRTSGPTNISRTLFTRASTPPPRASSVSSTSTTVRSPERLTSAPGSPATSPAPSPVSSPVKRNRPKSAAERRKQLEDHELTGDVEMTRAWCKRCESWVALSEKTPYSIRPWFQHVKRCEPDNQNVGESEHEEEEEEEIVSISAATELVSVSSTAQRRDMTEAQRRALLKADPRAEVVRSYEVLCRTCRTWVMLDSREKYHIVNWVAHQGTCESGQPSDRVASAERQLKLLNDSQAESFTEHEVLCRACGEKVQLLGSGNYNLTKWEEHKTHCSTAGSTQQLVADAVVLETAHPTEMPGRTRTELRGEPTLPCPIPVALSVASTEATLMVIDPPLGSTTARKRSREEVEEGAAGESVEARPVARAKTERYEAAGGPMPGLWDRLMVPWRVFVQGFSEGFRSGQ